MDFFSININNSINHFCPICNKEWTQDENIKALKTKNGKLTPPSSFEECYRYCIHDSCAISNSKNKPSLIFKNYELNIPVELSSENKNLKICIDNCICRNGSHLKSKPFQFSNYKSEDAFTWAFFAFIVKFNLLSEFEKIIGLEHPIEEILLWGTPIMNINEINKNQFRCSLIKASDSVNEVKESRTEPDVIIITGNKIVFIEVKVASENPNTGKNFEKYKNSKYYRDVNNVNSLYELVRNWTIGNIMAENLNKEFELINLMPEEKKEKETESIYQREFKNNIIKSDNYKLISWELFLSILPGDYKSKLLNKMNKILGK